MEEMQKSLTDNPEMKEAIINHQLPPCGLFIRKKLKSGEKKRSSQLILGWFKRNQ